MKADKWNTKEETVKKVRRTWRARRREKFRAYQSYNINDPVCARASNPVVSSTPGRPPSRAIYISVLFKPDCYSISTQLVNALLFNRVARRRAGFAMRRVAFAFVAYKGCTDEEQRNAERTETSVGDLRR